MKSTIMKKYVILIISGLLTLVSCQEELNISNDILSRPVTKSEDPDSAFDADTTSLNATDTIKISKWDALEIVEPITSKYPDRWVDISNETIPAGTEINYNAFGVWSDIDEMFSHKSPDSDSWLIIIGPDLSINARQTLLHLFVNVETGEITEEWLDGMAMVEWDNSRYIYAQNVEKIESLREKPAPSLFRSSPTKWAVIINGGYNSSYNIDRYWNDCQEAYNAFTQILNYPSNHIYCLISDGLGSGYDRRIGANAYDSSPVDYDGDGYTDVSGSATFDEISGAFNQLQNLVSAGDEVVVFITGPAAYNGNLYLWGGLTLSPSALDAQLDKLGTSVLIDVVLGTSYSGAFISDLAAENRTVVTATDDNHYAHSYNTFGYYDYFLRYWTDAINNTDPSVAGSHSNGDGYLSSFEIFHYANTHPYASYDYPQINYGYDAFSWGHDLEGNNFVPYLTGPDYASQGYYGVYSVYGLPSSYSLSWSHSGNLRKISSSGSSATIAGNLTSSSQFVSYGAFVKASFSDLGETVAIMKDIVSVWKPGQYMNLNFIQGGSGVYYVLGSDWTGTYGFSWESGDDAWQITGQNNNIVYVSEGYTANPVPLMVSFFDPLGGMIFVFDYVND